MISTYCCYIDMGDTSFEEVYRKFQRDVASKLQEGILPMIHIMKEDAVGSIGDIRDTIYKKYPTRPRICPAGKSVCCGCCTRLCNSRCAMDAYNKCSQVLVHGMVSYGVINKRLLRINDTEVNSVYKLLANPDTEYDMLINMTNALISPKYNYKVREEQVITGENPFRYDYAPEERVYLDPNNKKYYRVVNDEGYVQFKEYPETGLCAYCLPKTMIDRRRLPRQDKQFINKKFL